MTRLRKKPSITKNSRTGGANPVFEVYLQSLAPTGRKAMHSMLNTAARILQWKKPAKHCPWEQLTYQKVQLVRFRMTDGGYAINSINLLLCGLKSLAKTAFNLELMNADTLMRIQAVKQVKGTVLPRGRYLSQEDIKSMLKAAKSSFCQNRFKREAALILLGCGAGLRCSELKSLCIEDYDADEGVIHVKHAKGRKQRAVHLNKKAMTALNRWIRVINSPSGPLFRPIRKGGSITPKSLSSFGIAGILKELQIQSSIAPFSPHDMRRTFITRLLEQGYDLNIVRQLAGHSDISTTAAYDYREEDVFRRASQSLKL